jgi:hypothetical protein
MVYSVTKTSERGSVLRGWPFFSLTSFGATPHIRLEPIAAVTGGRRRIPFGKPHLLITCRSSPEASLLRPPRAGRVHVCPVASRDAGVEPRGVRSGWADRTLVGGDVARTNSRNMHTLRDEFFEEGKAQSRSPDPEIRKLSDCWLCRTAIDYEVDPSSTPDSHNLDHFHPVSKYPELQEDPTGFRHAHFECNTRRGNKTPSLGLGEAVADWW